MAHRCSDNQGPTVYIYIDSVMLLPVEYAGNNHYWYQLVSNSVDFIVIYSEHSNFQGSYIPWAATWKGVSQLYFEGLLVSLLWFVATS